MAMNLLVDDLNRVASGPNGLDPDVLMVIQRNLVSQVMQVYRDDYADLNRRLAVQVSAGEISEGGARMERSGLIKALVQQEYRHRAQNGQGFSLPMYVETASNHYRLEIQRLAQSLSDYVALANAAGERHYAASAQAVRASEPEMEAFTRQLAERLDKLETAIEGLGRVSRSAAPVQELRSALAKVFADAKGNSFAEAVIEQARNVAAAIGYERKHFVNDDAHRRLPGLR